MVGACSAAVSNLPANGIYSDSRVVFKKAGSKKQLITGLAKQRLKIIFTRLSA